MLLQRVVRVHRENLLLSHLHEVCVHLPHVAVGVSDRRERGVGVPVPGLEAVVAEHPQQVVQAARHRLAAPHLIGERALVK